MSGQPHSPAALSTPLPIGKESPSALWIEGWVGPRTGLDFLECPKVQILDCLACGLVTVLAGLLRLHNYILRRYNSVKYSGFWAEGYSGVRHAETIGWKYRAPFRIEFQDNSLPCFTPFLIIIFFWYCDIVSKKFIIESCVSWYRLYIWQLSVLLSLYSRVSWHPIYNQIVPFCQWIWNRTRIVVSFKIHHSLPVLIINSGTHILV